MFGLEGKYAGESSGCEALPFSRFTEQLRADTLLS